MARRTTGLNWIMWSSACPVLASLTLLIPELNNQSQWGLKQGQRQGRRCCSEQIITARENTMRDLGMWLDRQDVNTQPRTYTHTHTLNGLLHICGLWWTEMECTEDCLKEVISAELLASTANPNLQKNNIINQSHVPRSQSNTLSPVRSAVSLFLPDTTFVWRDGDLY